MCYVVHNVYHFHRALAGITVDCYCHCSMLVLCVQEVEGPFSKCCHIYAWGLKPFAAAGTRRSDVLMLSVD